MNATRVTIAIPTFNRADLLKISLRSALAQDYEGLDVLVIDNASSDRTESVVRSHADARLKYVRNERNLGLFGNWNRAVHLNTSPYLSILQDDDVLLAGFVDESVKALEQHPRAGFSTARTRAIAIDGRPYEARHREVSDPLAAGVICGLDFLTAIVAGKKWITPSSGVMLRSSVVRAAGGFDHPHCKDTIDTNLFLRLAANSDVVTIPQVLCEVRFHSSRESQMHFDSSSPTGPLASLTERLDAVGYLLRSSRGQEATFRQWLAERLLDLNLRRSGEAHALIPSLNYTWDEMLETVKGEIHELIPAGARFILADANKWGIEMQDGRQAVPLLERDGRYWALLRTTLLRSGHWNVNERMARSLLYLAGRHSGGSITTLACASI